jgi:CHASE3 domain sensor protein
VKKFKKRVCLGLGVLIAAYILFVVYDYLDNQKKEEQSRAVMEESNKVFNEYDIIYCSESIQITKRLKSMCR